MNENLSAIEIRTLHSASKGRPFRRVAEAGLIARGLMTRTDEGNAWHGGAHITDAGRDAMKASLAEAWGDGPGLPLPDSLA